MGINRITPGQVGLVGVTPSIAYIDTSDTEAQILTTGYLNLEVQNGTSFNLPCVAVVSTIASPGAAKRSGWYQVVHVGANWSLIATVAPGTVTLPTIANHIATYTDVLGTLSEDPATAISGGNIQAGLSGTAGYLASFPSAASKGSLRLTGVANTGDTLVTLSNAAHGQASVYSIPDSGASTANIIISKLTGTQHITVGGLQVDAGAVTSGISTGGQVGSFAAFPTTATSGSLNFTAAVNSSGNFNTTVSNSTAVAQSQVVSIPDSGNAAAQFMVGATGTPFVSGNIPKASGTAGLFVDSGITAASLSGAVTQLGNLYQVSVTFNTAQMVTAYDTPLTIVANPSASQVILLLQASVYTASTGHTPYATGTAPIIQYSTGGTNGQHGAGTIATAAGLVAGDITAAASQVRNLFGIATAALTGLSGKGIYFSNATGDYTAGTGTSVTFTLVYQLLTATI